MFDYETLRLIWWALIGIVLIGFAVTDGYDLGSEMLLPFVAKTDAERRVVINSIGPYWEGSQVWFIVGGAAAFAAWPLLYATAFSTLYLGLFLVLAALIVRPVSIVYRSKIADKRWRALWDWTLFTSGLVASLVFGVAFGNLFRGVPFAFDVDLRSHPDISLFGLLTPFALLTGLVSIAMLVLHGATWLLMKTEGPVAVRAARIVPYAAIAFAVLFALAGFSLLSIDGYRVTSALVHDGPSNPLLKTVAQVKGGWFANFDAHIWWWIAPLLAFACAAVAGLSRRPRLAFVASGLTIAATIATAGIALFPFLLPSSTAPDSSLTIWDASSTRPTLTLMLVMMAIFIPIILLYTAFIYRVMRGPVKAEHVDEHGSY